MKRNLTGLLLIFIGLIISIFMGFGFILTLIGICMLSGMNEEFKKSRNAFIGSLVTSIASFFIMIGLGSFFALILSGVELSGIGAIVGLVIAVIVIYIALFFFNLSAFNNLMLGCARIATEDNDAGLAESCTNTYGHFKRSILILTILAVAFFAFFWVPGLNIALIVAAICAQIYYIVAQIMVIIRVWQTYSNHNRP